MRKLIWRILTIGVVGIGVWLVPGVAGAVSVGADIVEPSPTNFQSWTFKPGVLTVHVGDVVQWRNTGQNAHTVTADNGAFDSGNLAAGAVFSFTFAKPGTYSYQCGYHPWMKGTIQVEGTASTAPTATSVALPPTRVSAPPTATPPRATPIPPTATAVPTMTAVPVTATTVPPTQTTAPTTATPESATATSIPAVGLVVETPQPTVPATPRPSVSTPTIETTSSLAGSGSIAGGLVALIVLVGIGLVVFSRSRGGKRVRTTNERHES